MGYFRFCRRVALKIINLGRDTKQVVARFEAGRQALAMMDHSNIAKVFDAGATEKGRPIWRVCRKVTSTATLQRSYWHNQSAGLVSDIPSEAELQPRLWGRMEFR